MLRLIAPLLTFLLAACAAAPAPAPNPPPVASPAPAAAPATPSAYTGHVAPSAMPPPGTPQAPPVQEIDNVADGTPVTLKRGGELKVVLDANVTTGFQWQATAKPEPVLSPIGGGIYVGKGADPRNVGAGGLNVFRFRGENPGTVTLQFEYRRGWEAGVAPAKVVRYPVTVQ